MKWDGVICGAAVVVVVFVALVWGVSFGVGLIQGKIAKCEDAYPSHGDEDAPFRACVLMILEK